MSILRTLSNTFRNNSKLPEVGRGAPESFFSVGKQKAHDVAAMETYTNNNMIHAITSRLANDVSAVQWKLYRKQDSSRKRYAYDETDDRVEVTVHAALTVLNKPNSFMTRQELIEVIQQWIDLTGEGWLEVEYAGNTPIRLWPKRPDKMSVVPSATQFILGYVYETPDGEKIPLARNQMIQLRMPNPLSMYRGIGPVQSLAIDLDASRYASLYNRNFFLNDATPGGIIEVPENMSEESWEKFVQQWRESHKGVNNSNKMAVLQNGMKYTSNTVTMRDMQFAELRGISDDAIMKAFGFPKFKLGIVDDVNRANADASEVMYIRSLLKPRLERIKQALNNDFLPLFGVSGEGVEFDYECEEPEDEQTESQVRYTNAQTAKMLVDAGFDPSMALEVAGLPPMMHTGVQNNSTNGNINSNENVGGGPVEQVVPD